MKPGCGVRGSEKSLVLGDVVGLLWDGGLGSGEEGVGVRGWAY